MSEKQYGFIQTEDGSDLFFMLNDVQEPWVVSIGDSVTYRMKVDKTHSGKKRAIRIVPSLLARPSCHSPGGTILRQTEALRNSMIRITMSDKPRLPGKSSSEWKKDYDVALRKFKIYLVDFTGMDEDEASNFAEAKIAKAMTLDDGVGSVPKTLQKIVHAKKELEKALQAEAEFENFECEAGDDDEIDALRFSDRLLDCAERSLRISGLGSVGGASAAPLTVKDLDLSTSAAGCSSPAGSVSASTEDTQSHHSNEDALGEETDSMEGSPQKKEEPSKQENFHTSAGAVPTPATSATSASSKSNVRAVVATSRMARSNMFGEGEMHEGKVHQIVRGKFGFIVSEEKTGGASTSIASSSVKVADQSSDSSNSTTTNTTSNSTTSSSSSTTSSSSSTTTTSSSSSSSVARRRLVLIPPHQQSLRFFLHAVLGPIFIITIIIVISTQRRAGLEENGSDLGARLSGRAGHSDGGIPPRGDQGREPDTENHEARCLIGDTDLKRCVTVVDAGRKQEASFAFDAALDISYGHVGRGHEHI
jgi:cold shock CspA family protein